MSSVTGTLNISGDFTTSGGGGTPASPNKSIQFNNSGSFGGSSDLLHDVDVTNPSFGGLQHAVVGISSTATPVTSSPAPVLLDGVLTLNLSGSYDKGSGAPPSALGGFVSVEGAGDVIGGIQAGTFQAFIPAFDFVGTIDQLVGIDAEAWSDTGAVVAEMRGVQANVSNYSMDATGVGKTFDAVAYFPLASVFETLVHYWGDDLAGNATHPFYFWFDSQGVRLVEESNTFDSVGQAIEALHNPQITKHTPGAANFERLVLGQWNGNIAEIGTEAGGTGTVRDLRLFGNSTIVTGLGAPVPSWGNGLTNALGPVSLAVVSDGLNNDGIYNYTAEAGGAWLALATSRGTVASPTATQSGDHIGWIPLHGYADTDFKVGGWIHGEAMANFTDTNHPGAVQINATPPNTDQPVEQLRLEQGENIFLKTQMSAVDGSSFTPVLAGTGAGNVSNGTHRYKFTFGDYDGAETDGNGAPTPAVTVVDNSVDGKVTVSIPYANGTAYPRVFVYRDKNSDGVYKLVGDSDWSGEVTFEDNIADGSLGVTLPTTNTTLASRLKLIGDVLSTDFGENTWGSPVIFLGGGGDGLDAVIQGSDSQTGDGRIVKIYSGLGPAPAGNTPGDSSHLFLYGNSGSGGGSIDLSSGAGHNGSNGGQLLIATGAATDADGNGGLLLIQTGTGAGTGHQGFGEIDTGGWQIEIDGAFTGGGAFRTRAMGTTRTLDAYDVDGAAYKSFATLTGANTPDFTIAPPSGGTVTLQATTFKSSDGSTGATAGPFTTISSITVKNGLVTAITGS